MIDTLKYFVKDGIYRLNNSSNEFIFVCVPSPGLPVGKLVQYKEEDGIYEKTGISYFLNCYQEGDIKSLFLNRDNYEMVGMLGQNYVMSDDEEQILKG